ncbi:MAG: inositol monophosphatase family protein, partial [Parvibaculum sp.]
DHPRFMTELGAVMNEVAGVRRMGSAALDLAYVAAGRFDAYWEANLSAWDIAAGIVLVREAGGFVADLAGRDDMIGTGGIVAGNDMLSRKLGDLLKKAHKPA